MEKTRTRGDVIVEDIKVGDIHYEYDMGIGIKSKVLTKPTKDENGSWVWKSENLKSGGVIDYLVCPDYPHYSVKLYTYEAYSGVSYV
jgi:hypothetical protein